MWRRKRELKKEKNRETKENEKGYVMSKVVLKEEKEKGAAEEEKGEEREK